MQAEIKNGNLVISIPLEKEFRRSSTGRSVLIASTHGFVASEARVNGESVLVSINAVIKAD